MLLLSFVIHNTALGFINVQFIIVLSFNDTNSLHFLIETLSYFEHNLVAKVNPFLCILLSKNYIILYGDGMGMGMGWDGMGLGWDGMGM